MKIVRKTTVTISQKEKPQKKIDIDAICADIARLANKYYAEICKTRFIHFRNVAVQEFYGSYAPIYYSRRGSLRYMAYPTIEDEEFVFYLGVDVPGYFANHRADEEYIYINSFEQGYHGGAPHNGIRWRTPYPEFTHWGRLATQGPSPKDTLNSLWDNFLSSEAPALQKECVKRAVSVYAAQIYEWANSQ